MTRGWRWLVVALVAAAVVLFGVSADLDERAKAAS